jgi:futalosine hydrolase
VRNLSMKILVIAATKKEIEPFITARPDAHFLITGIGIASTIYHLQKKLQHGKYELVIQAGIAGSYSSKYDLEEVVLIHQDTFGDIGAEEKGNFLTVFEMNMGDKNEFPFENGWLKNTSVYLKQYLLKKATGITINKVSDSGLQKKQLLEKFNAEIESMEGAALHYVCLQEKLPFIQIRGISNYVGERDKLKWKMKETINNLNDKLLEIVDSIIVDGR